MAVRKAQQRYRRDRSATCTEHDDDAEPHEGARCQGQRCQNVENNKAALRTEEGTAEAEKMTGEVVKLHDELTRQRLEVERQEQRQSHEATEIWVQLVQRQTSPLGPWHNSATHPSSLVLENVCGTSGLFTRLQHGYAGLGCIRNLFVFKREKIFAIEQNIFNKTCPFPQYSLVRYL